MKDIKQLLKEQRELCAEHYAKTRLQGKWLDMIKEEIKNAPEPELEKTKEEIGKTENK